MEVLNNKLKQIIQHLESPSTSQHTGDKNICYLTFPFESILEVKNNTETFISLLKHFNLDVTILSIGNLIQDYIKNYPRRENWISFSMVEYKDEMTDFFNSIGSNELYSS